MIKKSLIRLHWLLDSQFGMNPQRFLNAIRGLPRFLGDWLAFRKTYAGQLNWMPCLHDRYAEGGTTKSEYFWQDLLVARRIFEAKPGRHVDIGSRVDGFVAHVASFRNLEVFDVRPISTHIPGVAFKQADLMHRESLPNQGEEGYCDSLSCLHALEHFGLGRYGDPVDPAGHERGIANMASLLQPGGTFYLSIPIGRERVEFNAHRIFDPRTVIELGEKNSLNLNALIVISSGGAVQQIAITTESLQALAESTYNLGLYVFTKSSVESTERVGNQYQRTRPPGLAQEEFAVTWSVSPEH